MERFNSNMSHQELLQTLEQWTVLDPWFLLALMTVLTPEQWQALTRQLTLAQLLGDVQHQTNSVLSKYPRWFGSSYRQDIANEVMIRLSQGRFWKQYRPQKGHPRPYVIGCAYQYARTITRSFWRGFGKNAA